MSVHVARLYLAGSYRVADFQWVKLHSSIVISVFDIVVRYTSKRNGYVMEIAMYSYRLGTNGEPVAVDCRSLTVCPFCSVLYLQTYSNLGHYLIRPACLLPRLSCNFQCSM